jgi:hypothetical protein
MSLNCCDLHDLSCSTKSCIKWLNLASKNACLSNKKIETPNLHFRFVYNFQKPDDESCLMSMTLIAAIVHISGDIMIVWSLQGCIILEDSRPIYIVFVFSRSYSVCRQNLRFIMMNSTRIFHFLNILKEAQEVIMYLQQDGCDPLMLPHNFSSMMMSKETNLQNNISWCILENASPLRLMKTSA